ncbi:MAG TPA: segregation/condensation protein A [bacterium]|nr:segregation/condensation protein A [bacterium]
MQIKVDNFEGPLDLLLKLIEQEELDITKVSLAAVTEQYISYIDSLPDKKPDILADFLLIAAKLLVIKSRTLLPELNLDEEEWAGDLEQQLKMYKKYLEASVLIGELATGEYYAFSRPEYLVNMRGLEFRPPRTLNISKLKSVMEAIVSELDALSRLPQKTLAQAVSIKEKIEEIRSFLAEREFFHWHELAARAKSKTEIIVSFLGILELNKQRHLSIEQEEIFGEIKISNLSHQ